MYTGVGNVVSRNHGDAPRRWWLLLPVALLGLLSAYLAVKSIGAAAFYSAWGPITSATPLDKAAQLTDANHRAHIFFMSSVTLTVLTTFLIAPIIRLSSISSDGFRLIARYIMAFVLSVLATGILVWILGILKIG